MSLAPGMRLGPYEISGPLGAGGMGEVWRARDTKLGREVAVKVLPDTFLADPERLARLEREARLLASLNHPNIATLHAFENVDGLRFLVMELVEGPTLGERLSEGPLPVTEALDFFRQVADGLAAAHRKGVVHRDLKPGNLKIAPGGHAKILDFGLATSIVPAGAGDVTNSPTASVHHTATGVIQGTAPYMAPEQAKGKQGRTNAPTSSPLGSRSTRLSRERGSFPATQSPRFSRPFSSANPTGAPFHPTPPISSASFSGAA